MKPFAIALFVINLLALGYAWYATYLATPDRQPPRAELQPERIRLMSAAEATALAVKARQRACMEWGAFASADTGRAQKVLEAEGIRFTERRVEGGSRWWVHVPTLPTKRQADQRAQEIRKLGLTEDPVVQDDGRVGFSISIGLFSTEPAANGLRDTLTRQGIRDVAVQARENANTRVFLRLRDLPLATATRLGTLKQDFAGTELRECPSEKTGG